MGYNVYDINSLYPYVMWQYFQFPLWDTMNRKIKKTLKKNTFNSLYGIHIYIFTRFGKEIDFFQFPLWDTKICFISIKRYSKLSIPFMGYLK